MAIFYVHKMALRLAQGLLIVVAAAAFITLTTPVSAQALAPLCSDGTDNDNDGFPDAEDPGCHTDWNANNTASYDGTIDNEYEIERIDFANASGLPNNEANYPSISADGRFVTFNSYFLDLHESEPLYGDNVYLYDRQNRTTKNISNIHSRHPLEEVQIGNNNNSVIYSAGGSLSGGYKVGVFVHDLLTGSTTSVIGQGVPLANAAGARMGNISNTGLFTVFMAYSRIMSGYDPSNYF